MLCGRISVGAIRQAWASLSRAMSMQSRATRVLPEPTSPSEQAVHPASGGHVGADFFDHTFLRAGKREGQKLGVEGVEKCPMRGNRKPFDGPVAAPGVALNVKLKIEKLFEFQTETGLFELLRCLGRMDGGESFV